VGFVHVLAADSEPDAWVKAVLAAQVSCSVEGVVLSDDISTKAEINQAITLRADLIAKYGRWVWFILATQGMQDEEGQAEYLAECPRFRMVLRKKRCSWFPASGAMSRACWLVACAVVLSPLLTARRVSKRGR
jgi:hypothetical protein